jgi:putative transcriptional regulator
VNRIACLLFVALLPAMSGQEASAGAILLAHPDLPDPNFAHTVVLLVHTGEDGAMGLILNRPAKLSLKKLFPQLQIPSDGGDSVYAGGPVEESVGVALIRSKARLTQPLRVAGDVYFITGKGLLEKSVLSGRDAASFRVYLGYAGWGREQLDQELAVDAWTILPFKAETVFDAEPATLWERLNQKSHLQIATHSGAREWDRRE